MTVANGRQFLSIPGPTNVPDAVLQAMMRPAVDIYTGPLVAMTDALLEDLKTVFGTKGHTYIYAANGHGGWEAALSNVLSRGDHVLALESGRFALGWAQDVKHALLSSPRLGSQPGEQGFTGGSEAEHTRPSVLGMHGPLHEF